MDGTPRITIPDRGVVLDLPEDDYHAHHALGSTDLNTLLRSPAHFRARKLAPPRDTPATRAGRILHACILEREVFEKKYCVEPVDAPKDLRHFRNAAKPSEATLQSIAFWDHWEATHAGMTSISAKDFDDYRRIADCIRQHPELRPYFERATEAASEVSVFAIDEETGLPLKCRKDYRGVLGGVRFKLELKSADDARPAALQRNAVNYGYFLQEAHYHDVSEWGGEPVDVSLMIAFEKPEYPEFFRPETFPMKIYQVLEHDVAWGREKMREALALAKHCRDTDEYPGYSTEIEVLERPAWTK